MSEERCAHLNLRDHAPTIFVGGEAHICETEVCRPIFKVVKGCSTHTLKFYDNKSSFHATKYDYMILHSDGPPRKASFNCYFNHHVNMKGEYFLQSLR